MQVILLSDVYRLGDRHDVVNVKPGYARNYLIPQGLATYATASNKKMVEENKRQASHLMEKIRSDARQLADMLQAVTLRVPTLSGKDGKLFGSVTSLQIAGLLKDKGFEIDRRKIIIEDEIKFLGSYNVVVSLHKEVKAEIKIEVVDKEAPEAPAEEA